MNDVSAYWMPHAHCVLRDWGVILPSVIFGLLTFLSYLAIPALLAKTVLRHWRWLDMSSRALIMHGACFIFACGVTHVLHAWNWFNSDYRVEMASIGVTACVSLTFVWRLWRYAQSHALQAAPKL